MTSTSGLADALDRRGAGRDGLGQAVQAGARQDEPARGVLGDLHELDLLQGVGEPGH
jgi:hypothetical protein